MKTVLLSIMLAMYMHSAAAAETPMVLNANGPTISLKDSDLQYTGRNCTSADCKKLVDDLSRLRADAHNVCTDDVSKLKGPVREDIVGLCGKITAPLDGLADDVTDGSISLFPSAH